MGESPGGRIQIDGAVWETLTDSIVAKECTPFLGAGVGHPHLPLGRELSESLAEEFDYPLDDVGNLARVTQYIACRRDDSAFVKRRVRDRVRRAQEAADVVLAGGLPENHRRLAMLGLPLYITTNYDDYLQRALGARSGTSPEVSVCRWHDRLRDRLPPYSKVEPTAARPCVFHLHGHLDDHDSLLVTEDDYIDFTVNLARRGAQQRDGVIPHFVRRALGNTSLLFVGYSLEDWNFRVLMRYLMKQQNLLAHDRYLSLSIQLPDRAMPEQRRERAERFLESYMQNSSIRVHWGPADEFLEALTDQLGYSREGVA